MTRRPAIVGGRRIYRQPRTGKLRNIAGDLRTALHLRTDERGNDVEVLTGEARVDPGAPPFSHVAAFVGEYAELTPRVHKTVPGS